MENVAGLVPKHIKVKIIDAPCNLTMGDRIHLLVSMRGFAFNWKSAIIEMEENKAFVDCLEKGPISFWRHVHTFKAEAGGTLMTDKIEYALPFGSFGVFADRLFVKKELWKIFDIRHRAAVAKFSV